MTVWMTVVRHATHLWRLLQQCHHIRSDDTVTPVQLSRSYKQTRQQYLQNGTKAENVLQKKTYMFRYIDNIAYLSHTLTTQYPQEECHRKWKWISLFKTVPGQPHFGGHRQRLISLGLLCWHCILNFRYFTSLLKTGHTACIHRSWRNMQRVTDSSTQPQEREEVMWKRKSHPCNNTCKRSLDFQCNLTKRTQPASYLAWLQYFSALWSFWQGAILSRPKPPLSHTRDCWILLWHAQRGQTDRELRCGSEAGSGQCNHSVVYYKSVPKPQNPSLLDSWLMVTMHAEVCDDTVLLPMATHRNGLQSA